jgi:hypothetical protein
LDEVVPIAGKGQLEDHADYTVVEILDVALEAFAAFEDQGFEDFFYRGTLEADVARGDVFEAGIGSARAEDLAELVEANLFAYVELDQDQDRAAEGSVGGFGGHQSGQGLGGDFA